MKKSARFATLALAVMLLTANVMSMGRGQEILLLAKDLKSAREAKRIDTSLPKYVLFILAIK